MTLASGTQLGPYEIRGPLGAGGMGEVYRATDTVLKRDVAIKALPESLAADADRLARFQREAEVLASLNHPNIAQIYGLEKAGPTTALVMELVEGATLAERIAQGPVPADEALHIAMQITDALEAAHGQGIVHRDLKPANVKLKPDGTVKVLDFGIAKALETQVGISGPQAPSLTTPAMTQAGIILGTAAYMAPEQARGRQVDQRADIWGFGCVLYEMLTGQPAFGGEDVQETLARIITQDAQVDTLPGVVAPAVRHTIKLCLTKDVRKRVADIRDVRLALEGAFETAFTRAGEAAQGGKALLGRRATAASLAFVLGALVLGAALASLGWWSRWPHAAPRPPTRFSYAIPDSQTLRATGYNVAALSPDGRRLVYNTVKGLYVRGMGELEARLIPGTEQELAGPTFSPDGQWILYGVRPGVLEKIAIAGGAPVVLADGLKALYGASWGTDGTILYGDREGLYRVSANGGTPTLVQENGEFSRLTNPQLLPDGDTILFSAAVGRGYGWSDEDGRVVLASLGTGERVVLLSGGGDARYLPTGHIVYARDNALFAVPFDLKTKALTGGAVPIVQGVARGTGSGTANYTVANDGTLAYLTGATSLGRNLLWIDREGHEQAIDAPLRQYLYAALSPDGTRVALDVRDQENDIWVWDLERKTLQRLTFDPGLNRGVAWSPDGRLAFSREIDGKEEVYRQAADGFGMAEQLTVDSGTVVVPDDFTPDGKLIYQTGGYPRDIRITSIGKAEPEEGKPLIATAADEGAAALSPNGRWLAYHSDESGRYEIYVRPYPDVDSGRRQISTNGGVQPLWSRDGTELFYLELGGGTQGRGDLYAVPVEIGDSFRAGTPVKLLSNVFAAGNFKHPYEVSADGRRFLMIRDAPATGKNDIVVVQNWLEELERLAPTKSAQR